ncbi:MAG: glycoside hydrolase family 16 protein [Geminicoccaceae bacterium]|nr:glycoside hydrolase family 16 protein [Geminicoccaceae bacterium]
MNGARRAFACLVFVLIPWAGVQAQERSPYVPDGYELELSDEMNGRDLNKLLWSTHFMTWNVRHLEGNRDLGFKVADDEVFGRKRRTVRQYLRAATGLPGPFMHDVSNGTLKMRTYRLPKRLRKVFDGFPYLASMISMEHSHAQRYGYWEVKLRLNRFGKGHHLAFWMLPSNGSWPPEVDMLEVIGGDNNLYTNLHMPEGVNVPPFSYIDGKGTINDWMTIGFEWTPEIMRWTVNGKVMREHAAPAIDQPMYFLASWEVGSNWPGSPDRTTPWPCEVEIDHVRIYGQKSIQQAGLAP